MKPMRGFSLIEALIALVVLSVGLLGAAVMLLESLRTQGDALRESAATRLAHDMSERIRANAHAREVYGDPPGSTAASCESGCDGAQLAAADLAHFRQAALALLPPGATAAVEFAPAIGPAAPHRFRITLHWRSRDTDESMVTLLVLAPPVAG
jgi:type IV pilus assembly protein PilV